MYNEKEPVNLGKDENIMLVDEDEPMQLAAKLYCGPAEPRFRRLFSKLKYNTGVTPPKLQIVLAVAVVVESADDGDDDNAADDAAMASAPAEVGEHTGVVLAWKSVLTWVELRAWSKMYISFA